MKRRDFIKIAGAAACIPLVPATPAAAAAIKPKGASGPMTFQLAMDYAPAVGLATYVLVGTDSKGVMHVVREGQTKIKP